MYGTKNRKRGKIHPQYSIKLNELKVYTDALTTGQCIGIILLATDQLYTKRGGFYG